MCSIIHLESSRPRPETSRSRLIAETVCPDRMYSTSSASTPSSTPWKDTIERRQDGHIPPRRGDMSAGQSVSGFMGQPSRLTVKLSVARSLRRRAKALYPELRHAAGLTEADRASAPTIVRRQNGVHTPTLPPPLAENLVPKRIPKSHRGEAADDPSKQTASRDLV